MNIYKYTCFNLLDVYQFVSGYLQFDQWVMTIFETNFLVLIILFKLALIRNNGIKYCINFQFYTCKNINPCFLKLKF